MVLLSHFGKRWLHWKEKKGYFSVKPLIQFHPEYGGEGRNGWYINISSEKHEPFPPHFIILCFPHVCWKKKKRLSWQQAPNKSDRCMLFGIQTGHCEEAGWEVLPTTFLHLVLYDHCCICADDVPHPHSSRVSFVITAARVESPFTQFWQNLFCTCNNPNGKTVCELATFYLCWICLYVLGYLLNWTTCLPIL